jgi:homocysteine S-methyltransferase
MTFPEQLDCPKILILDGAMGTELYRRGVDISLPLWSASALWENPDIVHEIHTDYIKAGADIITTNTFRTDIRTFQKTGLSKQNARQATYTAVDLVKAAIKAAAPKRKIWIAGSMSPLEDCYHPELAPDYESAVTEHKIKASWLAESGVDFILIETMNSYNEALAATRAALLTGLPVITSFILINKDKILNGDPIDSAYTKLKAEGITAFSINCTHHSIISGFLNTYSHKIELPLAAYANAGYYDIEKGWRADPGFSPSKYSNIAKTWAKQGIKIIGGCCGTNPLHIRRLWNSAEDA